MFSGAVVGFYCNLHWTRKSSVIDWFHFLESVQIFEMSFKVDKIKQYRMIFKEDAWKVSCGCGTHAISIHLKSGFETAVYSSCRLDIHLIVAKSCFLSVQLNACTIWNNRIPNEGSRYCKKRWLKMNASLPCFMFLQVLMSKCASTPYQRNLKICVKIEII